MLCKFCSFGRVFDAKRREHRDEVVRVGIRARIAMLFEVEDPGISHGEFGGHWIVGELAALAIDGRAQLGQAVAVERVPDPLAPAVALDESGVAEDFQMVRHRRLALG